MNYMEIEELTIILSKVINKLNLIENCLLEVNKLNDCSEYDILRDYLLKIIIND